jgi:hypothetical protein
MIIVKMKSIRKKEGFKDIVSMILLLRHGPARRQTQNLRVCTLANIARITSLSISSVRRILLEHELQLQSGMALQRTKTRGGLKKIRDESRRPTELSEE